MKNLVALLLALSLLTACEEASTPDAATPEAPTTTSGGPTSTEAASPDVVSPGLPAGEAERIAGLTDCSQLDEAFWEQSDNHLHFQGMNDAGEPGDWLASMERATAYMVAYDERMTVLGCYEK